MGRNIYICEGKFNASHSTKNTFHLSSGTARSARNLRDPIDSRLRSINRDFVVSKQSTYSQPQHL